MTAEQRGDVAAWLDRLEELHANGDALPWHLASNAPNDEIRCYIADADDSTTGWAFLPEDAALIVAAVNAVPQLVAAIRGVLALADEADAESAPAYGPMWASDVRTVLAAALTDRTPR